MGLRYSQGRVFVLGLPWLPTCFCKGEVMAEFPGFTIWTDAYLADTSHLSTLEHGAYLLLLIAMWRAGGVLPNDDKRLARFARATDAQWVKLKPAMMEFFTVQGDEITQGRLLDELQKARNRSSRASENARAKHRKTLNSHSADALPEASQKAASISITTEEKKPSVSKRGSRLPEDFEPDLDAAVSAGLRPEKALMEAAKFKDYWRATAGAKGVKLDWPATWRNWFRSAIERQAGPHGSPARGQSAFREHQDAVMRDFERASGHERFDDDNGGQPSLDLGRQDFRRER